MLGRIRPPSGVFVNNKALPTRGFDTIKLIKDTDAVFVATDPAGFQGTILTAGTTGTPVVRINSPSDRLRMSVAVLHQFVRGTGTGNTANNGGGNTSGWQVVPAAQSAKAGALPAGLGVTVGLSGDSIFELDPVFPSSGFKALHTAVNGLPVSGGYEMDSAAAIVLVKFSLVNNEWSFAGFAGAGINKSTVCRVQVTWEPNSPIEQAELAELYSRCSVSLQNPVCIPGT